MVFFRKKKKKEDEDFDEEEDKKLQKSKKIKDLGSKNRKKRKEPKKPWGKKERLLVLAVLLLTVGTSGFLSLQARSWKLPGIPRISVPKLPGSLFGEKTIVIEANKQYQKRANSVINAFTQTTDQLSGVYGLYVIDLESNFNYGVLENDVFQAASLIKLPVMAAMYQRVQSGKLDLAEKYKLKSSDKVAGSGNLQNKPAGYVLTFGEILEAMGKQSDNTAFNISRNYLGDDAINDEIRSLDMHKTSLETNETSPQDIGNFFDKLYKGEIVDEKYKNMLIDSITDTIYENWLAAGVPNDVRVAHKFGREVHVVNDAGIVFTDKPYVVIILSKGVVERDADEVFPQLSRIVFEAQTSDVSSN